MGRGDSALLLRVSYCVASVVTGSVLSGGRGGEGEKPVQPALGHQLVTEPVYLRSASEVGLAGMFLQHSQRV